MLRLTLPRCAEAHRRSAHIVRRTPLLTSASVSQAVGGDVLLKAENLQRTGSFKLRGALHRLRAGDGSHRGVVAGSAGNHAQAVAYAAQRAGVPCDVYMPVMASVSKLAAVRAFGATVHQQGRSVDECVALASERAAADGSTFVHPFDDELVIEGQAGVGLELAAQAREVRCVVVPVGGGGLIAGIACVLKQQDPAIRVIGVQARACAPLAAHRRGAAPEPPTFTLADGIAVKRPGRLTMPLIERWVDDVVTVDDDAIAAAMTLLLERSKLVVEGAGAAAVAALLSGATPPAPHGSTVAVLSGGNVDTRLIAAVASRQETIAGRRARLLVRVNDRPGGLAGLLDVVAADGANLVEVEHVRDGLALSVGETGVQLTVEAAGPGHVDALLASLRDAGYRAQMVSPVG